MALLPSESDLTGSGVTNAEMKSRLAAVRQYLADFLGTDSSNKAAARSALGLGIAPRVMGLLGRVNAAFPLIRYDLSADAVVLRDANGATVARFATGWVACDFSAAGPSASGRDQAGAFPANSWVNLFFIWNGTTLATIASLAAPTAGPTLPASYTHWCYATTIRWNASSNIIPVLVNGSKVSYLLPDGGVNRVLAGGRAASMTSVSYVSLVPSSALVALLDFIISAQDNIPISPGILVRPSGQTYTGSVMARASAVAGATAVASAVRSLPNTGSVEYTLVNVAGGTNPSGGAFIDVIGYTVPNGDS